MIQIIPFTQYSSEETLNLANFPAELRPHTAAFSHEMSLLIALQQTDSNAQAYPISEEGLFVVLKTGQLIGYGNVVASTDVRLTSGIGRLNHWFYTSCGATKRIWYTTIQAFTSICRRSFWFTAIKSDLSIAKPNGGIH